MPAPDPLAPASQQQSACDRCAAPIRWLTTTAGPLAVDPAPDRDRGTVVMVGRSAAVLPASRAAAARRTGVEAYAPHSTSCPFGPGR